MHASSTEHELVLAVFPSLFRFLFLRLRCLHFGTFLLFARFFAFFPRDRLVFGDFLQFGFVIFLFELSHEPSDETPTGMT